MAEELLDKLRDVAEGQIDFEGQKLAEMLAAVLLSVTGLITFVVGFLLQDIKLAVYMGIAGTLLTFAVVVPPWPFYKKNPIHWLEPGHRSDITIVEKTSE